MSDEGRDVAVGVKTLKTDDDDNDEEKPVAVVVPERTPVGTWKPGQSGNPRGKPLGAVAQFSRELKECFGEHFASTLPDGRTKGLDAIERVWREQPHTYLGLAVRMVPQEVRVQESHAAAEMSDEELVAVVRMTRTRRNADDEDDDGTDRS